MNLTPEQLAQCMADFESYILQSEKVDGLLQINALPNGEYRSALQRDFELWQAAWRPRLTPEQMAEYVALPYAEALAICHVLYKAMVGDE